MIPNTKCGDFTCKNRYPVRILQRRRNAVKQSNGAGPAGDLQVNMYKKGGSKCGGPAVQVSYLAPAVQVTYLHEMRSRGEPAVQVRSGEAIVSSSGAEMQVSIVTVSSWPGHFCR